MDLKLDIIPMADSIGDIKLNRFLSIWTAVGLFSGVLLIFESIPTALIYFLTGSGCISILYSWYRFGMQKKTSDIFGTLRLEDDVLILERENEERVVYKVTNKTTVKLNYEGYFQEKFLENGAKNFFQIGIGRDKLEVRFILNSWNDKLILQQFLKKLYSLGAVVTEYNDGKRSYLLDVSNFSNSQSVSQHWP